MAVLLVATPGLLHRITFILLLCGFLQISLAQWQGHTYWNSRYSSETGWVQYDLDDNTNGLWSDDSSVRANYGSATGTYSGKSCSGCTCDEENHVIKDCTGNTITIKSKAVHNITGASFQNVDVTEITILSCSSFIFIDWNAFENLTKLEKLTVQATGLTNIPDLSRTVLTTLNLMENQVAFHTSYNADMRLPSTLTRVSLVKNQINWVPDGLFTGSAVKILALDENQLKFFPTKAVNGANNLLYLGLSNNQMKSISTGNMATLSGSTIQHLNFSNNALTYIEQEALSLAPTLKILELHRNQFTQFPYKTIYNMPELLHLDLNSNKLQTLTSKAIAQLPKLITLRLHSQVDPNKMTSIAYDAFQNIGTKLKYIWLSGNSLSTFPHQVLSEGSYPVIDTIWMDYNAVTSVVKFGTEAFPDYMYIYYTQKNATYVPFSTVTNLKILYLDNNLIDKLESGDFCELSLLTELHMESNLLTEATIPEGAFNCTRALQILNLGGNLIQYVPAAVKSPDYLPAIQDLRLHGNKLTFVDTGTFSNLSTLTFLQLQANSIITIEDGAFPTSLTTLYMGSNDFRFLNQRPFQNLSVLQELQLDNNQITELPDDAFHGDTALATIKLNGNKLARIKRVHFQDNVLDNTISLQSNDIGHIEDGTFSHITSCTEIDLSNNKLTKVPVGGDFTSLTVAKDVKLGNNRITSLPTGVFDSLNCRALDLSNNKISQIDSYAFKTMSTTQDLTLTGNPLRTIAPYAFDSTSHRTLDLQGMSIGNLPSYAFNAVSLSEYLYLQNNNIQEIDVAAFNGMTVGKDLYLNDNQLSLIKGAMFGSGSSASVSKMLRLNANSLVSLPTDAFQGVTLTELTLENNQLSLYPGDALSNQNLEKILMANNEMPEIALGSFTSAQNAMKELDVSFNKIKTLPANLLDPLSNLEIIKFQNNLIETVESGALNGLNSSLKQVYLQNNQLTWFPALDKLYKVTKLDLSSNQIQTLGYDAFTAFDPAILTYLDLGTNPLSCDCYTYATLHHMAERVQGGECASTVPVAGVTFKFSQRSSSNYYDKATKADFLCSPYNVTVSAPGDYQILLEWAAPIRPYPDGAIVSGQTWTYNATCTSSSVPTLSGSVSDNTNNTNNLNTTSSYLFTLSDGVVAGVDYVCQVGLGQNGVYSGPSPPVFITTSTVLSSSNSTAVAQDYVLTLTLYDFSANHPDFSGTSSAVYSRPTLIPSPYGAWPAVSSTPTSDTFSHWFRTSSGVNQVFTNNITLRWESGESVPTNRYSVDPWHPLDGMGYLQQGMRDCLSQLHNFGFTGAIRSGFQFSGVGNITVGGGDEVWVYVNRILLLEVIDIAGGSNTPCKTIDISPAAASGGATLTPYSGTIVAGKCVATTAVTSEQVTLNLEVGDTYHFDFFIVERKLCTSRIFLETQSIVFIQNDSEEPPMDYFVTLAEDFNVDGIVAELTLSDAFSVGPGYDVITVKGNEARHFQVKSDTGANRAAAVAPTPTAPSYTTLTLANGTSVSFIECNGTATLTPEPNMAGTDTISTSSNVGLFTLSTAVDYEVAKRYVVVMTVVDTAAVPDLTGQIVVRVKIADVNDNCPILAETSWSLTPSPTLQAEPLLYLNASDADSTTNGQVLYYASITDITPELSRYNDTMLLYLYDTVYKESSSVTLQVVALDQGSPPRGSTGSVSITLKNSCLLDVLLLPINHNVIVEEETGNLTLRIPKYWIYDYECERNAGMEAGYILDDKVSASSSLYGYWAGRGRINSEGWIAETTDVNQWISVDLNAPYRFKFLKSQGALDGWVTSYQILYSDDGSNFTTYVNGSGVSEFGGNYDVNTTLTLTLDPPILGQYIRINPRTWSNRIALRVDFVGCTQAEKIYYETSCERCETTYYCTGDGARRPCGRCTTTDNSTCDVNPTYHSFGAADQCSPCPTGWTCKDGYATPCMMYRYSTCNSTWCPSDETCVTTSNVTTCDFCTACETGHACQGGIRTRCTPGTYSDGLKTSCELCRPGTYQNESEASSCNICPEGYHSSTMKDRCDPCHFDSITKGTAGSGCDTCTGSSQCACMADPSPCASGVACVNSAPDGTSYSCGPCPPGYNGDGLTCTDIDECTLYHPCWNDRCLNTIPGYQCLHCPTGYEGTFEDAIGPNMTLRVFEFGNSQHAALKIQTCTDINECATGDHKCDTNAACINTPGSYTCGFCNKGYMGSSLYGCYVDDYCQIGKHDCGDSTMCVYVGPGVYRCECPMGLAGDGKMCGPDPDMDGLPTEALHCIETTCKRDECSDISNSGQEDNDQDHISDFCDPDDDDDAVMDVRDNCQYLVNYNQADTDSDGVGDACDNCPGVSNADQVDTDGDGQGDACDTDDDNDGVSDGSDNCPLVSNSGQENVGDSDIVGDACDNCGTVNNDNQDDVDQNGVGDACVTPGGTNVDGDGDSIPDILDNCRIASNPEQSDVDGDNEGDVCDTDIDGDGVLNGADNCPYVSNADQADLNGDAIGDACATDSDGDGVIDVDDVCPYVKTVTAASLLPYTSVVLYPGMANATDPLWEVKHAGKEVRQLADTNMPSMLIGPQAMGSMDYYGTWYVNTDLGQGYVGFVFGYHSNRKFYVVMWRHDNLNFNDAYYIGGVKGLQLKLVDATNGPGTSLANAIWQSSDTASYVKVLWHDPLMTPWVHKTAYRWHLKHRPSIGLIRVRVYQEQTLLVDSGDVYDTTLTGGRVGVFVHGQPAPIWSNLIYRCVSRENYALSLDGIDDSVTLPTVSYLNANDSFTLGVWVALDSSYSSGVMPVVCTLDTRLCLYVNNTNVAARYGDVVIQGSTALPVDYWTHLALRYEAQTQTLSVFANGTGSGAEAQATSVPLVAWNGDSSEILYIGRDNSNYYKGKIDEVRLYSIWLSDQEVNDHLALAGLYWQQQKLYLSLHYDMNDWSTTSSVTDKGVYGQNGAVNGNPRYVESSLDYGRYEIAYPNAR